MTIPRACMTSKGTWAEPTSTILLGRGGHAVGGQEGGAFSKKRHYPGGREKGDMQLGKWTRRLSSSKGGGESKLHQESVKKKNLHARGGPRHRCERKGKKRGKRASPVSRVGVNWQGYFKKKGAIVR